LEVNYGAGAEATMAATGSCPDTGDIETLVFNEPVIHSMMFIAG